MTWGRWYWPVWMIVGCLTLGIPEIVALCRDVRNTLSYWVWGALNVEVNRDWTAAHYLVFGGWLTVVSWLTWHFFFRRFV